MGFRGVEAEGDRGKDKAGGAYPQPIWGSEEGKLQLKKTEAGTRPGRAYPQPMWVSEVWKLKLKKTEAGTRPGGLILNQCGFPRSGS